ncbi:hypothetical protein RRF57_006590 [Xylaria bambusicola]|uniref:Protein kinase domain-containing protein n=1 Tax=Xylaria bambusicola TaxID=326684 RepID=A0AAN7YZ13_9PEZI
MFLFHEMPQQFAMAGSRGICYWVGTTLQAIKTYFKHQPHDSGVEDPGYDYCTNQGGSSGLGSNRERGHLDRDDPNFQQDSTILYLQTPQQALSNSTIDRGQSQEAKMVSSDELNKLENIRDEITEKLRESNENKEERFLVRSSLKAFLDIQSVQHILREGKLQENEANILTLAQFIIERALSVFAILIKMDRPHLIKTFHRDDFDEDMLPIRYEGARSKWSVKPYFKKASNPTSNVVLQEIFTQGGWTYSDVAEFCDTNQWHFFPLVFTRERFRYNISSDMRLPYTPAAKELKTAHSNYSRVAKRSIYPECFKSSIQTVLDDDQNFCVAVKTLIGSSESEADKEATALEDIRRSANVHLIKAIAYIRTEPKVEFSFVFPWAEHGNLWDFWVRQRGAPRNSAYFIGVFRQLRCLARAINELSDKNLRHGDLKPENIVCFKADEGLPAGKDEEPNAMVRLVIIDVGLAKIHDENTQVRAKTDTKVSTRRYAAPELETNPDRLSRRFDVWSMGCIFLEFAIWLIYGNKKLVDFTTCTGHGPSETEKFKFFTIKLNQELLGSSEPKLIAHRHDKVDELLSEMQTNPLCSKGTAIRRLVDLISNTMLVVDLSDDKPPPPETGIQPTCKCIQSTHLASLPGMEDHFDTEEQTNSNRDLHAQQSLPEIRISKAPTMNSITANSRSDDDNDSPSKPGRPYARVIKEELESILSDLENGTIDAIKLDDKATKLPSAAETSGLLNIAHRLNDDWDYAPDDAIARDVFSKLDPTAFSTNSKSTSALCGRCRDLRLWSPTCSFSDSPVGLEDKTKVEGCELCRLLLQSINSRSSQSGNQQVHFLRAGCYLTLRDDRKKIVANLCTASNVQIGFPELPAAASETHLEILKQWITDCDRSHECYPKDDTFIPTRLLDIRNNCSGTIRLILNNEAHSKLGHYATLSHRWGPPQHHKFFEHRGVKTEIKISALPRTFQDAVSVAYGLGLQYLWIDSLCIIQDDPSDWETESKLMEHVFSSSYCTIAASCSFGSGDGFLKARPARRSVTMQGPPDSNATYFVCETIDDFFQDVEKSELNQRGWVLQERALSRRTIYFTNRQCYWECGGGYAKGLRIEIFQDLYERYSRLALSYPSDRPIAIRGLESRLISTFGTSGGVGVFDIYLHRSLLWERASDALKSITGSSHVHVPSWSWMAYDGPISYLTIPFGEVTWSEDITSPFSEDGSRNADLSGNLSNNIIATSPLELEAPVWNLLDAENGERMMDNPGRTLDHPIQCVILGKSKMPPMDESQVHWVLLVHQKRVADNVALYERVGVAVLKKHHIAFDKPQGRKRIQ